MKLSSAIILASLGSANAFMAPLSKTTTALRMSDEASTDTIDIPTPDMPKEPLMSESLPFMERPSALDGSLAVDVGVDPLGFAKNSDDLMKYREAEVKHARLAMLAAAGWPGKSLPSLFAVFWLYRLRRKC